MRILQKLQLGALIGLVFQLLGCPQGQLNKDGQTSSTLAPAAPGTSANTRLWSISRDGALQTLLSSANDPVTVEWSTVGTFNLPANSAGVSAVSWNEGAVRRERAFFVEQDGRLRARAINNGIGSWLSVTNDPSIPPLTGPTSAVLLSNNDRRVGTITTESPRDLLVFKNLSTLPEEYVIDRVCNSSSDEISPDSIVVGAASGAKYCFAAQTVGGSLSTCPWNEQWTPPGTVWSGGASATAWDDGSGAQFVVYVRGADATIREARWAGTCIAAPRWTSLGSPSTTGVSSGRYAVSVASFKVGTDRVIELVVAGNDGKLYQKRSIASAWEPSWTELAAPADTVGRLGGVHVAGQGSRKTFFVGEVAPSTLVSVPAGYVFEASSGMTFDHTDPDVGLRAASEGASFPGAWTESSLAERNGKVIVGASVMSDASPSSVALSYSLDDGHSWRKALVPNQYGAQPNRFRTQGDPYAAMDSTGTGFVVMHELLHETICDASPIVYSSKIYVARTTNGGTISVDPIDSNWLDGTPSSTTAASTYLDHPTMAITSDDAQHYAWLWACYDPNNCPPGSRAVYYRKRNAGSSSYSAPIMVSNSTNSGLPYMFTGTDDKIFIAWANGHLHICPWNGSACAPSLINVTQPVNACAQALQFVNLHDQGTPFSLRSGGFAVAASEKDAGHIFAAFQFKEGTLGTPNRLAGGSPLDIAFMESSDNGVTWSNPLVITTLIDEVGTDQFMPSLTSHDDGTILLTYYDRSIDPNGSQVQQRVAIRHPNGTWAQHERRRDTNATSDLALLPRKCGGQNRFIGDYHFAVGGKTHAHALRVDGLRLQSGDTVRLQASAFSGSAWR